MLRDCAVGLYHAGSRIASEKGQQQGCVMSRRLGRTAVRPNKSARSLLDNDAAGPYTIRRHESRTAPGVTMTDDTAPILLETPRLVLRYQTAADVPALVALWADPAATRFMGGPRDRAWLQAAFMETARNPRAEPHDLWPVVEKATGRVVGHCGLLDKEVDGRPEVELVYVFAPAAWGKGYATEMAAAIARWARATLGLPRLVALVEPENAASERVALKVGMRLEQETVRPGGAHRRVYALGAAPD
jgi:ribosomal-protein-alanine N-acetyltransferase